jgi:hypothetical protein
LLEQAVKDLRFLSRKEQDRAAEVLLAFLDHHGPARIGEEMLRMLSGRS